ncbi:zinc finger protein 236-like isoform X1 [Polypterus senegalus]|uniref:zinc finger protein 236-like isoform X1 n=2 Tax=Polypterus senegalus TaxID=55291 RepID=UPI001963607B|nr:zinc finger protein 236-like isoform X1 [Polypterus senegalus]
MPRGRPHKAKDKLHDETGELAESNAQGPVFNQESRNFKCSVCSQCFSKESLLQRHLRDHEHSDKPYRCDMCPLSFNVEFNLTLHKSTHVSSDPQCPVCNKKFSRVASLKAHIMLHEKEENLICSECGDEFVLQSQLSMHLEDHRKELSGNKVYDCKLCRKEFKLASLLKEHMKTHYKIRPVTGNTRNYKRTIDRSGFTNRCQHCGKTFKKPSQLVRHVRIHTGERPFKCTHCGKAFNQKVVLQTHMIRHTGEKPHFCTFCPASFSQKGNLHSHIQRVHSELKGIPAFRCSDCSCVFKKLGSLNAHISKMHISLIESSQSQDGTVTGHTVPPAEGSGGVTDVIQQLLELSEQVTGENGHTQHPEATISMEAGLNQDILQQALENSGLSAIPVQSQSHTSNLSRTTSSQSHAQEPSVVNQQVDRLETEKEIHADKLKKEKKVVYKKTLQMPGSIREENGVRWHVCPYCSKEFKKPSDLVRHIRIHTHEKPFKCKQCFRAFAVKSTLTAHMKTHTGIKAFKCQYCMKCFSTSGSMKVHLRLHTGVRPFPCPHCDKIFRTSGHRKTHIASHFKNNQTKKQKYPRKPQKVRVVKNNLPVPDIPLQEPILITDFGLIQNQNPRGNLSFQHYLNLENERPYKCHFCNKAYKKSSHLKQHVRSHTGEKPFKCLQCSKGFASSGVLKAHIRTHSGLKAYKCLVCDSTFTTSGSLRRHMTIHSDVRPYMCPYCQKTFKSSPNCRKHMKTHRYELAQQIQQHQQQQNSLDDGIAQQAVTSEMQVEIEGDDLQQSTTVSAESQTILSLTQQQVVATQQTDLDQQLTDQPLVQDEDTFVTSQHALPQNMSQFEQQALPQQAFDQQGLSQGYTIADGYNQQSQYSAVQQLQDSSTLESQALSSSYHQQNLLQVSSTEVTNRLLQEPAQNDLHLPPERTDYQEENEEHSRRAYRCAYCNKGFKKSSHLKQHVRSHTGEKPFKCNQCGRCFVSAGVLKSHFKTHTGVKAFKCSVCDSSFTTNGSLSRHMTIHMNMKPYKCPMCEETFRTSLLCRKHVKKDHTALGVRVMSIEDENSERSLMRKNRTGIITFTEEQAAELAKNEPREDATISEKVLVQSAAERNRISEIKDKAVEMETEPKYANCCTFCPKSFKKPSDLVRHVRIHTGEKPYKCDECGKSFTVKSTLDCHVKTHSGQKLFSCHMCNTSFSTKGSLKVHMRLHTGSKPFKCPFCELRFRTSGHRKTHIQCHYKPSSEPKKSKKPVERQHTEALPPVSLLNPSHGDPSVFITSNPVLTSQFEQNLLQQGIVGQAILPASMSAGGDLTVSLTDAGLATLEGIQLQLTATNLVGPNVQISGIDTTNINNITLQIDSSILQQTLQQGSILSHQLTGDTSLSQTAGPHLQAGDSTVPANVVIQPLTGLSLQPTVTSANMTIGSLTEQDSVLSTSNSGTQDLSQVMTSQGLVTPNNQHEITLTINNSSLSQVLAQATSSNATNSSPAQQEITLTISGQDIIQQHNSSGGADLNGSIRLTSPMNNQNNGTTLTIGNDQLLPHSPTSAGMTGNSLPPATSLSQASVTSQNLVMSSAGVASDGSVTLMLADTQNMLSGSLDSVTLNITPQGQQFPTILGDTSLSAQTGGAQQQVILVSHPAQASSVTADETTAYRVTEVSRKDGQTDQSRLLNQCFYCNQVFLTPIMLRRHYRHAHGKERCHVCRICNKAFKRATHLKEHEHTHQDGPSLSSQRPRIFKCTSCDKAFAKPSQLERHNRTHTGERPFQCSQCEKAFNQKSALQVHMVKHTGEKPYKCEICAIGFTQKSNMKLHMKRSHGYAVGTGQEITIEQDQEADDNSRELDLEEVVQESATDWPCGITNVFR